MEPSGFLSSLVYASNPEKQRVCFSGGVFRVTYRINGNPRIVKAQSLFVVSPPLVFAARRWASLLLLLLLLLDFGGLLGALGSLAFP